MDLVEYSVDYLGKVKFNNCKRQLTTLYFEGNEFYELKRFIVSVGHPKTLYRQLLWKFTITARLVKLRVYCHKPPY